MRKFFRLFTLTAIMTLSMTAAAWAAENISADKTLTAEKTYEELSITGGSAENPVVIKVNGNVNVKSSRSASCINIKSGYVEIVGENNGGIYHTNDANVVSPNIIQVDNGATLTLKNVTISGRPFGKTTTISNYGNIPSQECVYHGIENEGTLNIENGTVITDMVTTSSYRLGCAIYTYKNKDAQTNLKGGTIKNCYSPGGGAITAHVGTVNMTGGAIYNTLVALYITGGHFNISGGVAMGTIRNSQGGYGNNYAVGTITGTYGEKIKITHGENTIAIDAPEKSGMQLLACVEDNITSDVGDKTYRAIHMAKTQNWDFIPPDHEDHIVTLNPMSKTIKVGETVEIVATVDCPLHENTVTKWNYDTNLVEKVSGSTTNKLILKAKNTGVVKVTAATKHTSKCEPAVITIEPDKIIQTDFTLDESTYTDLPLDGTNGAITVTIPDKGIDVKNADGGDCITIKGNVTIKGGPIRYAGGDMPTHSIINVTPGANLTLNNTLDGNNIESVYAGIYNEGNCTINGVVTNVRVDEDITEDGAVVNMGYVTVRGTIYGNEGYAIYDSSEVDAKDVTIDSGMVAGTIQDNITFYTLSNNTVKGRICCTYTDKEFEITNNYVTSPKKIMVKNGEILIASKLDNDTQYLSATINGKSVKCNIMPIDNSTVRWEFLEDESSTVSFVRGQYISPDTISLFQESHTASGTNKEESNVIGETSTIATAFYDKMLIPNPDEEYVYILCDINVPNKDTYAKGVVSGATYQDIIFSRSSTITDNDGSIRAAISGTYTDKIKFKLPNNSETSEYGIIINNLYAPGATVKMRPCTETGYKAATDYTEKTVSTSNDTAEVNF